MSVCATTPPTSPRRSWAEEKANELSEGYTSPLIPVFEIAEENGVNVVFADFLEYSEKVSGFCDFENAKLFVNKSDSTNRQSFTIAHELGHWILHRNLFEAEPETYPVLPRFSKTDDSNPLEQEANHFAANLLVPKRLLKPLIHAPVSFLADVFGVSRIMMEYRVKNVKAGR